MTRRFWPWLAALACAAATTVQAQPRPPGTAASLPPIPPLPTWQTDARHCEWHWRKGGGLGLWAETCRLSTGRWDVVWDPQVAAFVLRHDGRREGTVVQLWLWAQWEGTEGLTRRLREAGALAPTAPCHWQPVMPRPAPRTIAFWALVPKDPRALASGPRGEIPEPLCGAYGASTHGVRYFMMDLRWPTRAVFVDEGQERPMFDPASIIGLR